MVPAQEVQFRLPAFAVLEHAPLYLAMDWSGEPLEGFVTGVYVRLDAAAFCFLRSWCVVCRQRRQVEEIPDADDYVWLVFKHRACGPIEVCGINARPDLTVRQD